MKKITNLSGENISCVMPVKNGNPEKFDLPAGEVISLSDDKFKFAMKKFEGKVKEVKK